MPPKAKITRDEIVDTALELVRACGEDAINARAVAVRLNCSTQPIFSNFATMQELRRAVIESAYKRYLGYLEREAEGGLYPMYKSTGMAYIRFAAEERELFKLLFMRDRTGEDTSPPPDFEAAKEMIVMANGVTPEVANLMHLEMWCCVHGIGVMIATSFLNLEQELISTMLSDIYNGVRAKYAREDAR